MCFDFDAAVQAPHRMQPGLRRLAPGTPQLTPLRPGPGGPVRHLGEKLAVLGAFWQQALLRSPGFDPGPALQALASHAAAEHPQALQTAGGHWRAPWLGWNLDDHDQPAACGPGLPEVGPLLAALPRPWRRAALLSLAFAEDFAIVDGSTASLPWLAVALPSMWAPEDKLGRSFAEAHAPVADNRLVVGAAPQLVQLVTSAGPWERFVWTLTAHPRLHAHPQRVDPARWAAGLDDDQLAAQTWWRTERQTFIPVPGQQQAVFTILVNLTPLTRAFTTPAQAGQVHAALASMSDAVLAYRGLHTARPALLRWLARQAAGMPA
ncbi:MAG: heme-dependent oxidative N-demethylase subunit alpha family protein [Pseudomonadota bacterium]